MVHGFTNKASICLAEELTFYLFELTNKICPNDRDSYQWLQCRIVCQALLSANVVRLHCSMEGNGFVPFSHRASDFARFWVYVYVLLLPKAIRWHCRSAAMIIGSGNSFRRPRRFIHLLYKFLSFVFLLYANSCTIRLMTANTGRSPTLSLLNIHFLFIIYW